MEVEVEVVVVVVEDIFSSSTPMPQFSQAVGVYISSLTPMHSTQAVVEVEEGVEAIVIVVYISSPIPMHSTQAVVEVWV